MPCNNVTYNHTKPSGKHEILPACSVVTIGVNTITFQSLKKKNTGEEEPVTFTLVATSVPNAYVFSGPHDGAWIEGGITLSGVTGISGSIRRAHDPEAGFGDPHSEDTGTFSGTHNPVP